VDTPKEQLRQEHPGGPRTPWTPWEKPCDIDNEEGSLMARRTSANG
jgi:hypothetical protein